MADLNAQPINGRHRKLGQILLESGLVTPQQLERALGHQRQQRQRLGRALVDLGFITDEQIASVLAEQLTLPLVDLRYHELDLDAVALIPKRVAVERSVVPLKRDGVQLILVMGDPLNIQTEDEIRTLTGCDIRPAVGIQSQIEEVLLRRYGDGARIDPALSLENVLLSTGEEVIEPIAGLFDPKEMLEASGTDAVIRTVNAILADAVKRLASDIHFEPYEQSVRLRYRIDGRLRPISFLPRSSYPAIVSRLKILANLDIAENRRPQDGAFRLIVGSHPIGFRLSTLRTAFGETTVVRILDESTRQIGLDSLGMRPQLRVQIERLLDRPQGLLLATGPTGSGKTTTLYSSLHYLRSDEVNIVTVEDPIEHQFSGINQVQIDEAAGITFARALRSILRQDPNIIMIGEIRDCETAEIAIRAALTGHRVLATLHTNDACSTPARLIDMGVEPYLLGVSLNAVLAQRLVRRLCPQCSYKMNRPVGCKECGFSGYAGRLGIYELLVVDEAVQHAIARCGAAAEIEAIARPAGFRTMVEDAQMKIRQGATTREQVAFATGIVPLDLAADSQIAAPVTPSFVISPDEGEPSRGNGCAPYLDSPPEPIGVPIGAEEAPRAVVRVDIGMEQTRIAAFTDEELLAAQTYDQGLRIWLEALSGELGIPTEKLQALLDRYGVNEFGPLAPSIRRMIAPLAQALGSARSSFAEPDRESARIEVRWAADQFPGLVQALVAYDPTLRIHPLA